MAISLVSSNSAQNKSSANPNTLYLPSGVSVQTNDVLVWFYAKDQVNGEALTPEPSRTGSFSGNTTLIADNMSANTGNVTTYIAAYRYTGSGFTTGSTDGFSMTWSPSAPAAFAGVIGLFRGVSTSFTPVEGSGAGTGTTIGAVLTGMSENSWLIQANGWEGPSTDYSTTGAVVIAQTGTTGGGAASNIGICVARDILTNNETEGAAGCSILNSRDYAYSQIELEMYVELDRAPEHTYTRLSQSQAVKRAAFF